MTFGLGISLQSQDCMEPEVQEDTRVLMGMVGDANHQTTRTMQGLTGSFESRKISETEKRIEF